MVLYGTLLNERFRQSFDRAESQHSGKYNLHECLNNNN